MVGYDEWIRMVLLYVHLLFCVVALGQVFETDLRIALGKTTIKMLSQQSVRVGFLLFAMWVSGLSVIYMDTGFDLLAMSQDSKLLLKITCVAVLSMNSLLLHWYSLPAVMKRDLTLTGYKAHRSLGKLKSVLIVYIGALSLSNWLLAAFVGASEPLGKLGFSTLFKLYLIIQGLTFLVTLMSFPYLNKRLMLLKTEYENSQDEFNGTGYGVIHLKGTVAGDTSQRG
jgi:hypothetical protein